MSVAADAALAARLAGEAGRLLVGLRARAAEEGWAVGQLRDEGDRRSHEFLLGALRAARPGDAVLSEEGDDDPDDRCRPGRRVWIVDPLDGTREYGEGRDDWAVHVALAVGEELVAGAVALPVAGLVLASHPAPVLAPRPGSGPVVVVSRTRPARQADAVVAALGGTRVALGSAGAKAMAVVRGEADVYVHDGTLHEWDAAAPAVVALAAGCSVTRLDGSPLRVNAPRPLVPDLVVCRPELADAVLGVLAVDAS